MHANKPSLKLRITKPGKANIVRAAAELNVVAAYANLVYHEQNPLREDDWGIDTVYLVPEIAEPWMLIADVYLEHDAVCKHLKYACKPENVMEACMKGSGKIQSDLKKLNAYCCKHGIEFTIDDIDTIFFETRQRFRESEPDSQGTVEIYAIVRNIDFKRGTVKLSLSEPKPPFLANKSTLEICFSDEIRGVLEEDIVTERVSLNLQEKIYTLNNDEEVESYSTTENPILEKLVKIISDIDDLG